MEKTYLMWGYAKRYVVIDNNKPSDGDGLMATFAYKADMEAYIESDAFYQYGDGSYTCYKWNKGKWEWLSDIQITTIKGLNVPATVITK